MSQYILTISENKAVSSFFDFIKKLDFVQKVEQVEEPFKPLSNEDWIKPGRPETDEKFEQMIKSAEESKDLNFEEAISLSEKKYTEWSKRNPK
jgi:hypothetical protein